MAAYGRDQHKLFDALAAGRLTAMAATQNTYQLLPVSRSFVDFCDSAGDRKTFRPETKAIYFCPQDRPGQIESISVEEITRLRLGLSYVPRLPYLLVDKQTPDFTIFFPCPGNVIHANENEILGPLFWKSARILPGYSAFGDDPSSCERKHASGVVLYHKQFVDFRRGLSPVVMEGRKKRGPKGIYRDGTANAEFEHWLIENMDASVNEQTAELRAVYVKRGFDVGEDEAAKAEARFIKSVKERIRVPQCRPQ